MYKKPEFTTVSDSEVKTMVNTNFLLGIPIYVIIVVVIAIARAPEL